MTKYDVEAYPYSIRSFSHPVRVGALAQLYGMEAAPFGNCRVLEIGGGDGINVINMAIAAPGSDFVNFDLSSVAVDEGRSLVRDIGLSNISMKAMDILEAGADLGKFDYVIAHGGDAWVPPQVRNALMALIGRILTPRGIALISYNAAPGCHIRRAIRDLVHRAAAPYESAQDRTRAAREVLEFHSRHWNPSQPAQAVFRSEAERILQGRNNVLFHDELSDEWHPQFLSDVIAEARKNGLDHLGDIQSELIGPALFPDDFTREAEALCGDDPVAIEQMRDYRDARSFRITLLRRGGAKLDRRFSLERLNGLYVDAKFDLLDVSAREGKAFGWKAANGIQICTSDGRIERLCQGLNKAWPQALPVEEIATDDDLREAVGKLYAAGGLGIVSEPYALTTAPGERPLASRVARAQLDRGIKEVATLRHSQVRLDDDLSVAFLMALDGTRDQRALIDVMRRHTSGAVSDLPQKVESMVVKLTSHGLIER